VWLIVAIAAAAWMLAAHASRALLLLLAVPVALAALGFLQAREQTCVFHAVAGTRENDDGVVKLDPRARGDVIQRARRVALLSLAIAVGVAVVIYAVS
jgi:hypothetical protein